MTDNDTFIDWGSQEDEGDAHDENQEVVILDDEEVAALDGEAAVEFTDYENLLDLPDAPANNESITAEVVPAEFNYRPSFEEGPAEYVTVVQIDPHTGQEISEVVNLASPPLDENEARALTERIRSTTNILYLLIKRAHAGKAYQALGYNSFAEYIREEFAFSRAYAYRLLDQANVIEAIEEAAPEGTKIYLGNPATKELKKVLPLIIADVEERTAGLDSNEAVDVIEDIIRDHREQLRNESEDDDFDGEEGGYGGDGPYEGNGRGNGDEYDDDFVGGDDDVDAFAESDPGDQARLFNTLYNVFAGMKNIMTGADADNEQIIQLIPAERDSEFAHMFKSTLERVTVLSELLEQKMAGDTLEGLDDDEATGDASEGAEYDPDANPDSDF